MRSFSYKRTPEGAELKASGELTEIAAEVGYMVRYIYASVMKRDPEAAELFKAMTLVAIADPETPTWNVAAVNVDYAIVSVTEK